MSVRQASREPPSQRTIAVGLVWNDRRELLLGRMSPERGVFPGQWGLPGGGVEPGESLEQALSREMREELGIEIGQIRPAFFKDGCHDKVSADGSVSSVYMIFLIFHCRAEETTLTLNEEWIDSRWARAADIAGMDVNAETLDTLERLGAW